MMRDKKQAVTSYIHHPSVTRAERLSKDTFTVSMMDHPLSVSLIFTDQAEALLFAASLTAAVSGASDTVVDINDDDDDVPGRFDCQIATGTLTPDTWVTFTPVGGGDVYKGGYFVETRPTDWDESGELYHYFRDGFIRDTQQSAFGFPASQLVNGTVVR